MSLLPLDVLARIPLLPVLIWQGLSVRRNALILPEASGPRSGVAGTGPELRLLILGDSSAAGVGVSTQSVALSGQVVKALASKRWVSWQLIARSGATTADAIGMLEGVRDQRFDVVLLALGVNDAVRLARLGPWRKRQADLREKLRASYGAQHIIVTAVPPIAVFPALPPLLRWILGAHAARMDQALEVDLKSEVDTSHLTLDAPFTPEAMAEDGYHPSADTYAFWGQRAVACILEPDQQRANDSS